MSLLLFTLQLKPRSFVLTLWRGTWHRETHILFVKSVSEFSFSFTLINALQLSPFCFKCFPKNLTCIPSNPLLLSLPTAPDSSPRHSLHQYAQDYSAKNYFLPSYISSTDHISHRCVQTTARDVSSLPPPPNLLPCQNTAVGLFFPFARHDRFFRREAHQTGRSYHYIPYFPYLYI